MKQCKLCKGQITEKDLIHINVYQCSKCGEQQREIDLIIQKSECTGCNQCKELGECVYETSI